MISIPAHWTSFEYTILAIRELHRSHTGKNIAETVYIVSEEFGDIDKLKYVTMNDAGNNDTNIEGLDIRIRATEEKGFDPKRRRLRYSRTILNRVMRMLVVGNSHGGKPKSWRFMVRRKSHGNWRLG